MSATILEISSRASAIPSSTRFPSFTLLYRTLDNTYERCIANAIRSCIGVVQLGISRVQIVLERPYLFRESFGDQRLIKASRDSAHGIYFISNDF